MTPFSSVTNELVINQTQYTTSTTTDSNGTALLDTASFNKQVQIELVDDSGNPVGTVLVEYQQTDGKVEITVDDPTKLYAKTYYYSDLNNIPASEFAKVIANKDKLVARFIGEQILGFFINDAEAIVVSGPILVVGLGLSLYAGYTHGGYLYNLYDFVVENHKESDITTTTIRTTVGEFTNVIPDAISVATLPLTTASNVALVATGGASFKVKKAIDIGKDVAKDEIKGLLIAYLFNQLGKAIGEDTVIDVKFYHFAFLMNNAKGAVSIEVVENEVTTTFSDDFNDGVLSNQWVADSSNIDGSSGVILDESNGLLTVTVPEPDANCDTHYLWSPVVNLNSDFTVEYVFEKQGYGHSSLYLTSDGVIDGSSNDNALEFYISTNDTPYVRIRNRESGSSTTDYQSSNSGYLNTPLTFRVERSSNLFSFYINNSLISENISNSVLNSDSTITFNLSTGTCLWKSGDGVDSIDSFSVTQ